MRGLQPVGRKARDRADAGLARRSACAQLSALPAPSEVTTPMPVTTTIGRPALSCVAPSPALPQSTASTSARPSPRQWPTPVTTTCASGPSIGRSTPDASAGGNSAATAAAPPRRARCSSGTAARRHDRDRCRWRAPATSGCCARKRALLAGRGLGAGRARDDGARARLQPRRDRRPTSARARRATSPGCAPAAVGHARREPRERLGAARLARARALSSTRNAPSEPSAKPPPSAARSHTGANVVLQSVAAELVEQQHDPGARRCRRRRPARSRSARPRCAHARCAPRRRRPLPRP